MHSDAANDTAELIDLSFHTSSSREKLRQTVFQTESIRHSLKDFSFEFYEFTRVSPGVYYD